MKRKEGETRGRGDAEIKHKSTSRRLASSTDLFATLSPHPRVSESPNPPFQPSKRFGQNFLTDQRIIHRIIEALEPGANDTIVEIGPGNGALTGPLLEQVGSLVAIEFDRNLIPMLDERFSEQKNFKLIQSDALITDICDAIRPATSARIVANLPYNIATAILQRLIEQRGCLSDMILMLQKEVVDRITAPPGGSDRGYLSVFVQAYCKTEKLFDVAPGAFRPAPKVWSSVIKLRFRPRVAADVQNEKVLWQVVSAGFAQRRKTILNNLRNASQSLGELVKRNGGASIVLCQAKVDLQRRAETLTLEEWASITRALH